MKKLTAREIFSIPNILSYFRLILIPVFCTLYLRAETQEDFFWAAAVVLISSLTDLLDGKIARHFNMITDLGKVLDPVADKLTHVALVLCLAFRHPMMWILLALLVFKETYMLVMGIYFLQKRVMLDGAIRCGKVCTAVLFPCLVLLFLFPQMPEFLVNTLLVVMMCFLLYSLFGYASVFRKMRRGEMKSGVKQLSSQKS